VGIIEELVTRRFISSAVAMLDAKMIENALKVQVAIVFK
jgi:hypothetical protein